MRKISANYIFPISQKPLKNGILILDDNGYIIDIIDTKGNLIESENLEFYNGILVPGFINTHCHLELSHLKNVMPKHTGLPGFLLQLSKLRVSEKDEIISNIINADKEMQRNGIVAVGDVSNNELTFETKSKSKIKYHTFIEIFDINNNTEEVLNYAYKLRETATECNLSSSIVPHAPYTVSSTLFNKIFEISRESNSIISIHNQENQDENKLYINKSGKFFESGIVPINFEATGFNSLPSIVKYLMTENNKILVHNTFTTEQDIKYANKYLTKLYWVICPNANLYIENKLPDIEMFIKNNQNITIGTDSLASNNKLSILNELITISNKFPSIPLELLLSWATINGAVSLNLNKFLGSFEKNKKPGVNLLQNINFSDMRLTDNTMVKALI